MRAPTTLAVPVLMASLALGLGACASKTPATSQASADAGSGDEDVNDPYESTNRFFYDVNDKIDRYSLKPAAQAYVFITPLPVRTGIHNFLSNLSSPALFANDEAITAELAAAADAVADPLWRLPLWQPYNEMLKSNVADLNNAPSGGFAGAMTAALFLERFETVGVPWAHLDTFAWRPLSKPGRPKGGDALGMRAAWELLRRRFAP